MCLQRYSLVAVIVIIAGCFAGVSHADFTYTTFTGDADSGISSSNTYTCAVDMNGQASRTVNGVAFEAVPGPGTITSGEYSGTNWSATGLIKDHAGDATNVTGAVGEMMSDFLYKGEPITITLTNLTAGSSYKTTFYSMAFGQPGEKWLNVTTSDGGSILFDQCYSGDRNGNLLMYDYTGPASGELTFTFAPEVAEGSNAHLYAFANQAVPEPSTLILTMMGMIGLVAYAWRKRR